MTRPSTEAEYLARMVPSSSAGCRAGPSCAAPWARRPARGTTAARRRAAAAARPEAAAARPAPATGTVSLGSNQSDAVPKAAVQSVMDAFQKANSGADGQDQHDRPQLLPGEHQQLPAGLAGRRLHVVLRLPDAVLRRQGPRRRHLRRLGQHQRDVRRPQEGVDRRRRQAVLRPVDLLPVGDLLPQERLRGEGLQAAEDPRRAQDPRRQDEEGRPRPDRLRATRTAGPRWARSTSSTCGSTATTSTSA